MKVTTNKKTVTGYREKDGTVWYRIEDKKGLAAIMSKRFAVYFMDITEYLAKEENESNYRERQEG